jgi:hypothetical protein
MISRQDRFCALNVSPERNFFYTFVFTPYVLKDETRGAMVF